MRINRLNQFVTLAIVAAAIGLAGCANPSRTASPATTPPPLISVARLGGLMDKGDTIVVVAQDGSWVFTDRQASTIQYGTLTAAERDQLRYIVNAPDFAEELLRAPGTDCADAFHLTVTVGLRSATFTKCDGSTFPKAMDAVGVLAAATPLFTFPDPVLDPTPTASADSPSP